MAEEGDIIYSNSPNVQVYDSEGTLHRAQLVAVAPGEIRFNDPDNSPNVMVADDEGVYHRAQLVAMIGGGGGINEDRIIIKSPTIPTADVDSFGKFYCFSGESNSTYTHGYIYQCIADVNIEYIIDLQQADPGILVNKLGFDYTSHSPIELFERIAALTTPTFDPASVKSGSFVLDKANEIWYVSGYDADGNLIFEDFTVNGTGDEYSLDAYGFVYIDHFPDNFEEGYTEDYRLISHEVYSNYRWAQMNVQPSEDSHNLGWFATPTALRTAYPTAEAGDYAIVGSTDTVWVWDSDTNAWVDTDTKGQVTSVNNQTGDVTITATDILPSQTGHEGQFLFTNGSTASWRDNVYTNTTSETFTFDENTPEYVFHITPKTNRDIFLNIMVYEGMDDGEGNITKGQHQYNIKAKLSYKDISEDSTTNSIIHTYEENVCIMVMPSFAMDVENSRFDCGFLWTGDPEGIPAGEERYVIVDVEYSDGVNSITDEVGSWTGLWYGRVSGSMPTPVGLSDPSFANGAIPLFNGSDVQWATYPFMNIFGGYFGNHKTVVCENGTYVEKYYSQVTEIPATAGEEGSLYEGQALFQYIGETTNDYTQGYFYKIQYDLDRNAVATQTAGSSLTNITVNQAVFAEWIKPAWGYFQGTYEFTFDGSNWSGTFGGEYADLTDMGITYTGTPVANDVIEVTFDDATWTWVQVNVQPAPAGLPDQTGQSGKFLTTDGSQASWSNKPLVNKDNSILGGICISPTLTTYSGNNCVFVGTKGGIATAHYSVVLGYSVTCSSGTGILTGTVAIGYSTTISGNYSVVVGCNSSVTADNAIQLGYNATNNDANTFKVSNFNGNFEMMSADGTIPTGRLTKVNTTITLASANWSSNTQTVNVTGMTATGVVLVSPIPADQADYTSAGIICSAQGSGTLTFTCDTAPSSDIDVVVVML